MAWVRELGIRVLAAVANARGQLRTACDTYGSKVGDET
jgi:hypothetical protein